jgi:hypothetical protein
MKKVAINQSNYVPWKGYFDLIHDVDIFVFYDDVQFTKNDWRNRNRVKGANGTHWITIPVGDDWRRSIRDVEIRDHHWQVKHWKTLSQLYGKTPHFKEYRAFLEHLYLDVQWNNLSQLNQHLIETIAREFLRIQTAFLHSSDLPRQGVKQDAVISLLKAVDADLYVSGPAAQAYLQRERFEAEDIQLVWKDYSGYPDYPQIHPPFEHRVTILDLLFHTGRDAPYFIWGWREDNKLRRDALGEPAIQ